VPLQLQKPQIHVATLGLQKTAVPLHTWGALSNMWKRRGTPVMNSVRNHASKLRRPPRSAWPREIGALSGNRGRLAGAGLGGATAVGAQYVVPGADTVPGPTDTTPPPPAGAAGGPAGPAGPPQPAGVPAQPDNVITLPPIPSALESAGTGGTQQSQPPGPTDTATPGPTDTPAQPGMFESARQYGSDMYDAGVAKGSELADGAVSQFRKHQKDPSAYWSGIGQQAAGLGSSTMQHVKDNAGAYGVGAAGLALLHWLHSRNQKEEEPQFKAAAVTRQLDLAATQHPFVVGFLTKLAADGRTGEQVERAMNTAAATPIVGDEVVGFLKTAGAWDNIKGFGSGLAQGAANIGNGVYGAAKGTVGAAATGLSAIGSVGARATDYTGLTSGATDVMDTATKSLAGDTAASFRDVAKPFNPNQASQAGSHNGARVQGHVANMQAQGNDTMAAITQGADMTGNIATNLAATAGTGGAAAPAVTKGWNAAWNAAKPVLGAPAAAARAAATAAPVTTAAAALAGSTAAGVPIYSEVDKLYNPPRDLHADSLFGEDGQLTTQFTSPEAKEQGLLGAYDELSQAYSTPGDPAHNDAAALTAGGRRLYGEMSPETAAERPELRQRFGPHPAERDQYMATGLQQDMEVVQNEQADPAQRQEAATRATENAVAKSAENMGMDMQSAIAEGDKPMDQANPDAVEAFGANPDVQAKVQRDVESGAFPDFMSGLKSFWDGMDGTQTMALLGGLALAAVGIMSSLFGDGGMGGALLGALGLGIAGVGSGALDQLMGQFGGSTEPTAQTPDPQASQPPPAGAAGGPAGPAGPPQPAGVPAQPDNVITLPPIPSALESAGTGGTQQSQPPGDVTQASASQPANRFANTPLAGVFADGQLSGEEVQQTMNDPAAVNHILDGMPDEDAGALIAQAAKADPQFMALLKTMNAYPALAPGVLTTPRGETSYGYPGMGLTSPQATEMLQHAQAVPGAR
jgi:hypothetical protein